MSTVGILYADYLEDNENSILGGRMSVTSGFWGVFLRFPIEVRSTRSNRHPLPLQQAHLRDNTCFTF